MTREAELTAALQRLSEVVSLIVGHLDLDPEDCSVNVTARSPGGERRS